MIYDILGVQAHRRRELLEMNDNTFLSQPPSMKYKTDFSDRSVSYFFTYM